ncbi:MAG: tRNA epoxyqueuosine(34) reductase QueG [Pseudomonadota bacterium]
MDLKKRIKSLALKLGASDIAFTNVKNFDLLDNFFIYKNEKNVPGMEYISNSIEKRLFPLKEHPFAKTAIMIAVANKLEKKPDLGFKIAEYALSLDYHIRVKEILSIIEFSLQKLGLQTYSFVDAQPVLEKHLASRAGLGKWGKNGLLYNKKCGSYFNIGGIFTDLKIKVVNTNDLKLDCGDCNKCIEACPTNAIKENYKIDPVKCISYQTIENKEDINESIKPKLSNYIFGCDICQLVCPKNSNIKGSLLPLELLKIKSLTDQILSLDSNKEYKRKFSESPLGRLKLEKIKNNIKAATSN